MKQTGFEKALEIQQMKFDPANGIDLGNGWRGSCIKSPEHGSITIPSKEIYEIKFVDKFNYTTYAYVHSFEYDLSEQRLIACFLIPKASIGDNVNSIFIVPQQFKDSDGNLIPLPEVIFDEYWDKAFCAYQVITTELHQVIKQHMMRLPARYHELQKMKEDRVAFQNIVLDGSPSKEFYCYNVWKIQTQPEYKEVADFVAKIIVDREKYKVAYQKFKAMVVNIYQWTEISPKKFYNLNQLRLSTK